MRLKRYLDKTKGALVRVTGINIYDVPPPIIDKEGEVKDLLKSIAKDLREADNIDKEQLATAFDKLGELLGDKSMRWSGVRK